MANYLDGKISNTANWFYTVLFWISIIGSIIFSKEFRNAIKNLDFNKDFCHYIIMFFYIIYLITQLVTTGFRKFMRIQGIKAVLRKNIEQKFKIIFHGEAYHQESNTEENGTTTYYDSVSYERKFKYEFKSGADYSIININTSDINNKRYCDLEIYYSYICFDSKTEEEKGKVYQDLDNEIRNKDHNSRITISVSIDGMHSKNIISFSKWYIIILDRFVYIICIFLSFGQVYKHIICRYMAQKKIKITKIISNHYDLTSANWIFNTEPYVTLFDEKILYNKEKRSFKNSGNLELILSEENPLNNAYIEHNSQNNEKITTNKLFNEEENNVVNSIEMKEKLI